MNKQHELSQSSLLQEMVKIKGIHFKKIEEERRKPKVTYDYLQRKANFEEFKAVYEDGFGRKSDSSLAKGPYLVHKSKSGSLYRYPRGKKTPRRVETINIELPLHYGADRAVQIVENKIKPKKSTRAPNASRSREYIPRTLGVPIKSSLKTKSNSSLDKPKKSVTIVDKLNTIEEVARFEKKNLTTIAEGQLKEIQNHLKSRKEKIHKNLPKLTVLPKVVKNRKKDPSEKIMSALANINEKLQNMQEKYFNNPRIQYKNVNSSFTQSRSVELLYENGKLAEKKHQSNDSHERQNLQTLSSNITKDAEMQPKIKEMNDRFPEFPKIEDTLLEIEDHLDNIVRLKSQDIQVNTEAIENRITELTSMWARNDLNDLLVSVEQESPLYQSNTEETILNRRKMYKNEKIQSYRHQIEDEEDFCDKMSEIGNDEQMEMISESSEASHYDHDQPNNSQYCRTTKDSPEFTDYIEGQELQSSIQKSNYLSKEFNLANTQPRATVKIFSENKLAFWRDKMQEIKRRDYSVESVTHMIDNLKFTLENSIYEPVTK